MQVKHTWDYVQITNASDRRLVVNDIDAVLLEQTPRVEVALDSKPDNARAFPDSLVDPRRGVEPAPP